MNEARSQSAAPPDAESLLLQASRAFEQLQPWSASRPSIGGDAP